MRKMPGEVGNWVSGDRFWGRETELALLHDLIVDGANVSIVAQRRIGKTSLMREVGNRLPSGHVALHIDLQDAHDAADLVVKLVSATRTHDALWRKISRGFANALQAVLEKIDSISVYELELQLRAGLSGDAWREKGAQALAELAASGSPVVLFIDELPILVNRMLENDGGRGEVHALLSWLRAQAQAHNGKTCMVFAGSIGLEPVLGRAGLTADINHLTPFLLDPWEDGAAKGCLLALAAHRELDLPEESIDRMLELLGCNIPHHVQLFFAQVRDHCMYAGISSCPACDVELVFEKRMLGSRGHAELTHMVGRLEMVLDRDDIPLAMELLTQAAVTGSLGREGIQALCVRNGLAREQWSKRLPPLFDVFEHDGYLRKNRKGEYVFVSNLLRQWWRARFEAFFEPV